MITFSYSSLPQETWVEIFCYLDFDDLVKMKVLNRFFLDCSKALSARETLFTAPLDERVQKKMKVGNEVELHPALNSFGCVVKREEEPGEHLKIENGRLTVRRAITKESHSEFSLGRVKFEQLPAELLDQTATKPPLTKIQISGTEWTTETLKDFRDNPELWDEHPRTFQYVREVPLDDAAVSDAAITIGDVLNYLVAVHLKEWPDYNNRIDWERLDFLDQEAFNWERMDEKHQLEEAHDFEEDGGLGTELNWDHYFKQMDRDRRDLVVREKYKRENPPNTARFVLDSRFHTPYRLRINSKKEFYVDLLDISWVSDPLIEVETRWGELFGKSLRLSCGSERNELNSLIRIVFLLSTV